VTGADGLRALSVAEQISDVATLPESTGKRR